MWITVNTNEEIKRFMASMCEFHDSCIKEMHYVSGAYVGNNLGMYPLNDKRLLKVVIQRQFDDPSMLEMEFSGIKFMKLQPLDAKYTCEISGAVMFKKDGLIYWCDDYVDISSADNIECTLICAEKLRWRSIAQHIGADEFYKPHE